MHYYFDYRNEGGVARDDVGLELSGLEEAIVLARRALADAVVDETLAVTADPSTITIAIDVRTAGEIVHTVVAMAADLKVER